MTEHEEACPQGDLPVSSYRIIGASAIGPLHVVNDTPCQDAYSFGAFHSGYIAIAVADGLGSAAKSEIGARLAVDSAVDAVKKIVEIQGEEIDLSDVARRAVFSARDVLERKAEELQCKLRELACTLIVAVLHKDRAAVAHIGDGAVVVKTDEGLELLSGPDESEYANEVSPITGDNWEKSLRITPVFHGISGMMAFTDGCQRAALKKAQDDLIPFEGFCLPLFSYASNVNSMDAKEAEEEIKSLLLSKKVCDNSDDDKTLVIAVLNTKEG